MIAVRKIFFFYLLFTVLFNRLSLGQSFGKDSCAPFTLNIEMRGADRDTMRLLYYDCFVEGSDTFLLVNGQTKRQGTINRATEAILFTDIRDRYMDGPKVIRFILEPGRMNLSFNLVNDTVRIVRISGSSSEGEKERWEAAHAGLLDQFYYNDLLLQWRKFRNANNLEMQDVYQRKIDSIYERRIAAAVLYIKANPNSYFSGYLLWKFKRRMGVDSAQVYYTALADQVRHSQIGKGVWAEMFRSTSDLDFRKKYSDPVFFRKLEKIRSLHDISFNDSSGAVRDLSKLKGRYVVVDFWASWCGGCFENIPYLRKLAEEMKGAPVEFVSISIDTDVQRWKKALAELRFPGLNLVDTAGLAATYYKVPWVPKYVLIAPDGTIAYDNAPYPISGDLKSLLVSIMDKRD